MMELMAPPRIEPAPRNCRSEEPPDCSGDCGLSCCRLAALLPRPPLLLPPALCAELPGSAAAGGGGGNTRLNAPACWCMASAFAVLVDGVWMGSQLLSRQPCVKQHGVGACSHRVPRCVGYQKKGRMQDTPKAV